MERPKGPSPILSAFYSSQDSREFWVSMVRAPVWICKHLFLVCLNLGVHYLVLQGGYDAGYLA